MAQFLHADYKPTHFWAHKLLVSLSVNVALKAKHTEWSRLPLSTLAFSIETRLGALEETIVLVDQNLTILDGELKGAVDIDTYIMRGAVYSFQKESAVRRVLIGANCFITECRSCFENLACFYREFSQHYFSENVSKLTSYEMIASLTYDSRWADNLRTLRHDVIHDQAPWLAFLVNNNPKAKYEPILVFNSRAHNLLESDYVPFENLRRIAAGLAEAVQTLAKNLTIRVESTQTLE